MLNSYHLKYLAKCHIHGCVYIHCLRSVHIVLSADSVRSIGSSHSVDSVTVFTVSAMCTLLVSYATLTVLILMTKKTLHHFIFMHVYACMYMHAYVCIHVYAYICMHAYHACILCMHTHTYTMAVKPSKITLERFGFA